MTPEQRLQAARAFWTRRRGHRRPDAGGPADRAAEEVPARRPCSAWTTSARRGTWRASAIAAGRHGGPRAGRLSPGRAARLMGAFLDALGIAHENGLIEDDEREAGSGEARAGGRAVAEQVSRRGRVALSDTLLCQDPETWGALADFAAGRRVGRGRVVESGLTPAGCTISRHAQVGRPDHRGRRRNRARARRRARGGERLDHHARRHAARSRAGARWCAASSPDRSPTLNLLDRMLAEFEVECVFHLAALLSTRAEFTPVTAHHVNVEGTLNLLEFAQQEGESHGRPVVFVYPSSIAAYGLPDLETKMRAGRVPRRRVRAIRRRCTAATSCIARSWAATTRGTTSSCRSTPARTSISAAVRFPGLISADDGAVGRHLRLRARDDSRGGQGRGLRVLRAAGHDHSVHGDARRRRTRCGGWRRRRASG